MKELKYRMYAKSRTTESGCIEYTGTISKQGYGKVKVGNKLLSTHRLSYEIEFGHIPEGKFICHKCNNRKCMNPKHLYAGSPLENARDTTLKNPKENRLVNCEIPVELHSKLFKKCSEIGMNLKDYLRIILEKAISSENL